jgi:23S rRNA (cytidine1920-2'-O)/16S rRNA (cytidine1409-2'-O)-methyltransferase
VSFISLEKVLPAVVACMAPEFVGVLLVKPQFEAGPERVGKGGVVRDPVVHEDVLGRVVRGLRDALGLDVRDLCDTGVLGVHGNREFLAHVERGVGSRLSLDTLDRMVKQVVAGGEAHG